MPIQVMIPTPLRKFTGDKDTVEATGSTIRELIDSLEGNYPGIKERLLSPEGQIPRFLNIYLGDEDVRHLQQLDTPVKDGDSVSIIPAIAGG
ncbi:MoaD/ThiS family protein [Oscillatoria laete-virens NRMC-F 0139]|nr:MoaD/ThiS family protein [Oscillatoria laete-virens]MDL5054467.1 MoaD/ThiS family protein [Oscillatoria laete-virens NRMC-F 0139]